MRLPTFLVLMLCATALAHPCSTNDIDTGALDPQCDVDIKFAAVNEEPPPRPLALIKTYHAGNFFDSFHFQDDKDRWSHGFTRYVGKDDAVKSGLAKVVDGKVRLGADSSTHVYGPGGRKSVRLESKETFSRGLLVGDFDHMPGNACGIWPSFWLNYDSAEYSEIDIVEGISRDTSNVMTMYTSHEPCDLASFESLGVDVRNHCYGPNSLQRPSCGITAPRGTFGDEFNRQKGGVWALLLHEQAIKIWFFPRSKVPEELRRDKPEPWKWGTPAMNFRPERCDISRAFQKMQIILNITFCGSNAGGNAWKYTECVKHTRTPTCEEFVGSHPEAFKEAYFLINHIKVFSF